MKVLTTYSIKVDLIDMTPAETGEITELCTNMKLHTEWCNIDRRGLQSVIVYFDDPETLGAFKSKLDA